MKRQLPAFCGRDCGGDACPLLAEIEDGRVLRMLPNPAAGPWIRPCAKGFKLPDIHYSPHRLREPLVRTGERGSGAFKIISWPEAIERARAGLDRALEAGGPLSIMDLSSAGSTGAVQDTGRLTRRFLNALGGCSVQEGNYSSNAAAFALKRVFGSAYSRSGMHASALSQAGGIILLGANILEARLGAELPARLSDAAGRGTPVISIDPRRTSTAKAAGATWLPMLPGTDCALLYSILYILDRDGLLDMPWIEERASGFGIILSHVRGELDGLPKTPAWAQGICGLPVTSIEWLAGFWASTKPLCLIPGYSIQRTRQGEEAARLCVALQLATKNFGLEGASRGSLNNRMPRPRVGTVGTGSGLNRSFPVLRWPDAILGGSSADADGKQPRIRAAYSAGGNYLNQGADIGKNARALGSLDFFVAQDLFLTPTAMMADLVLPAASPLQKEDIGIPWAGNYLLYKPRILPSLAGEKSDYEIFRMLAAAFGREGAFTEGLDEGGWVDRCIAESDVPDAEEFKRLGIYIGREEPSRLLASFCADPRSRSLDTPSGRLELGFGERAGFGTDSRFPFLLITPKAGLRVHSQGGEDPEGISRGSVGIGTEDARVLGIAPGARLRLSSPQGSLEAEARIEAGLMPGVVCMEEGTWHRMAGDGSVSSSPNLLTSTEGTAESVSCVMHGISVAVERADL